MDFLDRLLEKADTIVALVVMALAIYNAVRSGKAKAAAENRSDKLEVATQIAVSVAEAIALHAPPSAVRKAKDTGRSIATRLGVEPVLNEQVVKATKERMAVDSDGNVIEPPSAGRLTSKLALLIVPLLLLGACVRGEARNAAALLEAETIKHFETCDPTEAYFTNSAKQGFDREQALQIWKEHKLEVLRANRKLNEALK